MVSELEAEQLQSIQQYGSEASALQVKPDTFVSATVNEVLRYRPVALAILREARGEGDDTLQVEGYAIPKGNYVGLSLMDERAQPC